MVLPATDSFDSGTTQDILSYSANWTNTAGTTGTFEVRGGANDDCHSNDAGSISDDRCVEWNADTFDDDQYAETTIDAGINFNFMGVGVRCGGDSSIDYYAWYGDSAERWFFVNEGGSFTTFDNDTTGFATGGVLIRMEAQGTTIRALEGGTEIYSTTDSTFSSGAAGITGFRNTDSDLTFIDDWEGGNLAAPLELGSLRQSEQSVKHPSVHLRR